MDSDYLTITGPSEAVYREKMSRFLAFAFPVGTPTEAKEIIARMANEYHDARHVCWAYMTGRSRTDFASSDNGEPSGTAGKPILGQINSAGLTNIVIVVVRYFGGIKLGTSGLIGAYREAARMAIEAAKVITVTEMASLRITFPYLAMNEVMKIIKQHSITVMSQEFDNLCDMTLSVPVTELSLWQGRFTGTGAVVG